MHQAIPGDGNQESAGQSVSPSVNMSTTETQRSPTKCHLTGAATYALHRHVLQRANYLSIKSIHSLQSNSEAKRTLNWLILLEHIKGFLCNVPIAARHFSPWLQHFSVSLGLAAVWLKWTVTKEVWNMQIALWLIMLSCPHVQALVWCSEKQSSHTTQPSVPMGVLHYKQSGGERNLSLLLLIKRRLILSNYQYLTCWVHSHIIITFTRRWINKWFSFKQPVHTSVH